MPWPDAINAVPVAPTGTLGGTTPTHTQLHDLARAALIEIRDHVDAVELAHALSDETTSITATGNPKLTRRMPHDMTLTSVRASLTTASSSGVVTVDINAGGTSILSTKLTIDQGETTSTTAATPAVISDSFLADDAEITFDVDTAGTGAKGLKVTLLGTRGGSAPAADIAFVAASNTTYTTRTTTTVTKPTGTTNGDYILLGVLTGAASPGTADPTPPAGFTLLTGFPTNTGGGFVVKVYIYGKFASGEGASWDFTHTSCSSQGFALSYRNVNTGTPLDATPTTNAGTGTTSTALGLTTVTNNAMIVFFGHDFGDTTNNLNPPTGTTPTFTERIDVAPLIYAADGLLATSGATGNKTMTNNSSAAPANPWAAALIALRPA